MENVTFWQVSSLATRLHHFRLLELVKLSTELHTVNEEARAIVTNCTTKLRGIYHQAALSLFIKENMPSGQLQILVDAFDDLIYDKKLNKEILSKVRNKLATLQLP